MRTGHIVVLLLGFRYSLAAAARACRRTLFQLLPLDDPAPVHLQNLLDIGRLWQLDQHLMLCDIFPIIDQLNLERVWNGNLDLRPTERLFFLAILRSFAG